METAGWAFTKIVMFSWSSSVNQPLFVRKIRRISPHWPILSWFHNGHTLWSQEMAIGPATMVALLSLIPIKTSKLKVTISLANKVISLTVLASSWSKRTQRLLTGSMQFGEYLRTQALGSARISPSLIKARIPLRETLKEARFPCRSICLLSRLRKVASWSSGMKAWISETLARKIKNVDMAILSWGWETK